MHILSGPFAAGKKYLFLSDTRGCLAPSSASMIVPRSSKPAMRCLTPVVWGLFIFSQLRDGFCSLVAQEWRDEKTVLSTYKNNFRKIR